MALWLFKSEPEVFSIDDLARRQKGEPWNGVRNYQVRNWLRDDIQKGDLAFFYHSNCKTPGIVGTMKVIKSGYIDTSAFDPQSPYYDAKSHPEKPRWYCVDVAFLQKFANPITLEQIKSHPHLRKMRVAERGNRLSITPVTENEWRTISLLASTTHTVVPRLVRGIQKNL